MSFYCCTCNAVCVCVYVCLHAILCHSVYCCKCNAVCVCVIVTPCCVSLRVLLHAICTRLAVSLCVYCFTRHAVCTVSHAMLRLFVCNVVHAMLCLCVCIVEHAMLFPSVYCCARRALSLCTVVHAMPCALIYTPCCVHCCTCQSTYTVTSLTEWRLFCCRTWMRTRTVWYARVCSAHTTPWRSAPHGAQVSWEEFQAVFDEDDEDETRPVSPTEAAAINAAAFESDDD